MVYGGDIGGCISVYHSKSISRRLAKVVDYKYWLRSSRITFGIAEIFPMTFRRWKSMFFLTSRWVKYVDRAMETTTANAAPGVPTSGINARHSAKLTRVVIQRIRNADSGRPIPVKSMVPIAVGAMKKA